MQELLEITADRLKVPHFGLQLSQLQDIDMLGPLGLLMTSCNTVKDAILAAQRYMAVHSPAENWVLSEVNDVVYLTRFEYETNMMPLKQIKELSLGACSNMLNLFAGQHFTAIRIELSHSPISDLKLYRKVFKADVMFNQEYDQILFDKRYLAEAVNSDSHNRNEFLEEYVNKASTPYNNIEREITAILIQQIGSQNTSLDSVADKLNINKRTLQRLLKSQHVNFKEILSNLRGRRACWYLSASVMSVTLISETLGYKDVSAFSRAFKKRYGSAPLQWRNNRNGI
ncbi:AraC family transcriptional regulator [Shewanella sp. D64]|nr:AraC family transcriptional regulator [Shewanella sp. D64]MEC4739555.1 AraC family transcriptional regulator [Shewanella sp. E94]WBJ96062.1 AraC family transcriptional regulator [Shewanella sp. MTB7]